MGDSKHMRERKKEPNPLENRLGRKDDLFVFSLRQAKPKTKKKNTFLRSLERIQLFHFQFTI